MIVPTETMKKVVDALNEAVVSEDGLDGQKALELAKEIEALDDDEYKPPPIGRPGEQGHIDWRAKKMVGAKLCKCGKWFIFVETNAGKNMPVDHDTGKPHFATCEHAELFRRRT